jgi:hypothetical protein
MAVFPTRLALTNLRAKKVAASKGKPRRVMPQARFVARRRRWRAAHRRFSKRQCCWIVSCACGAATAAGNPAAASSCQIGRVCGAACALTSGYDLLKKKSDALTFRFRDITRKIKEAKDQMGELARVAAFSLSEAVWAAGDFKCVSRRQLQCLPAPRCFRR